MENWAAQNSKTRKNIVHKNKNPKFWVWGATHKFSILTGIFGLKRIYASHYNHFTI